MKEKIIPYLLLFAIFVFVAIYTTTQQSMARERILKSGKYVLGTVIDVRNRYGYRTEYKYFFEGQTYYGWTGQYLDHRLIGARYLVKVDSARPFDSRLLESWFLPATLTLDQPDSGWTANPITGKTTESY